MKTSHRVLSALVVLVSTVLVIQTLVFIMVVSTQTGTDASTGQAASSGTMSFVIVRSSLCTVNLTQGWTLMSLCANVTDNSIPTLLSGIDYRYVMRWNVSSQSFDIYSPRAANPPFSTMEFNTSYFVNLNSASASMGLSGENLSDTNVSLGTGWNGPGYPYLFGTNITRYFNASVHRYLMKWNASSQEFIVYSPRAATPAFTLIANGEGQMLNAVQADILRYNVTFLES